MNKITLEDVSEYLEQYHKYQNYGIVKCIFHFPDAHPSLMVSNNGYKCMSCGERGSLEKLYEKVSGRIITREKVYNPSATIWRKWEEKFGSIQNIARVAHNNLKQNPDLAFYLQQRKIDEFIKVGMFGFLDGYYTFPIKNEYGEVDGIVARASPSIQTKNNRYTVSKNCPTKLYVPNWRGVLKSDEIYVPFGIIDSWVLHKLGLASVTGISGQELNSKNLDRFRKPMWGIPDKGEERKAMDLQAKLGWRYTHLRLDWIDGTKDLSDVYMKTNLDTVSRLIETKKKEFIYV